MVETQKTTHVTPAAGQIWRHHRTQHDYRVTGVCGSEVRLSPLTPHAAARWAMLDDVAWELVGWDVR